jgi:hypothetical protein
VQETTRTYVEGCGKNRRKMRQTAEVGLTPKTIIEQAGVGLEKKTNGLVQFYLYNKEISGKTVSLTFSLWASTFGYHYPFLKVQFPMVDGYPVELVADKFPDTLRAANEEELLATLGKIFQAPSTIDIVQKLIALSQ